MGMNVSIEGSNPSFSVPTRDASRRRSGDLDALREELTGALAIAQHRVVHVHRHGPADVGAAEDALESHCPLAPRLVPDRVSCAGEAAVGLDGDQGPGRTAPDER